MTHLTTELTLLDEELLVSGVGPPTTSADPLDGVVPTVVAAAATEWLTPPAGACLTEGGGYSVSESR